MAVKYTQIDGTNPGDVAMFVRQVFSNPSPDTLGYVTFHYKCKKCNKDIYKTARRNKGEEKGRRQLSQNEWQKLRYDLGGHYLHHHQDECKSLPQIVKKLFSSPEFR